MTEIDITQIPVSSAPPLARIEREALTWPQRAAAVQIIDQASYDNAVELLKAAKNLRKEAEEHHRPVIAAALASHKAALAALNRVDDPLEQAERHLKIKIARYTTEQEAKRREAERKAQEEAERKAAEELERELEAIEAAGAEPAEVAAVIAEAERVPVFVPPPPPTYQAAKGVSTRVTWSATVTSQMDLIRWVGQHPEHAGLLTVNQAALNALARSMQSNLNIPGVKATPTSAVSVR
jgi:hypothetical protein